MTEYLEDYAALDKIYFAIKAKTQLDFRIEFRKDIEINPKKLLSYIDTLVKDGYIKKSVYHPFMVSILHSNFNGYVTMNTKAGENEKLQIEIQKLTKLNLELQNRNIKNNLIYIIIGALLAILGDFIIEIIK